MNYEGGLMSLLRKVVIGSLLLNSGLGFTSAHQNFLEQQKTEIAKKTQSLEKLEKGETQKESKEVYELYLQKADLDLQILQKEGILNNKEKYHVKRFLAFVHEAQRALRKITFNPTAQVARNTWSGRMQLKKIVQQTEKMKRVMDTLRTKVNRQKTRLINDTCKKGMDQQNLDKIFDPLSFLVV